MFHTLLQKQYGLHLKDMQKSKVGAGSDTWFLDCNEGKFVLKFPSKSKINHPELEPELCAFLRKNGIPACDFLKNTSGNFVCETDEGKPFTMQRLLPGNTPPMEYCITRAFDRIRTNAWQDSSGVAELSTPTGRNRGRLFHIYDP